MSTQTISTLWAIAYETWELLGNQTINVKGDIQYEKATCEREARYEFLRVRPNIARRLQQRKARIVAIGPVLGYNVEDKDGKILSV